MRFERLQYVLAGAAVSLLLVCVAPAAAAAATPSAVATMLHDATGYTPSQVTTAPVCGGAAPGYASCDAEVLVRRSNGGLVRPLAGAMRSSASVPRLSVVSPSASRLGPAVQEGGPAAFTPQFLQEAYDLDWLSATAGAGQTIAIVDAYDDPDAASDVSAFRAQFGLAPISHTACTPATISTHSSGGPCMVEVNQQGQTNDPPPAGGWDVEESLDLDAVSSLCPNCNILYVETDTDYDTDLAAGDAAALELGAKLISNSFGGPASSSAGDYFTSAEDATSDAAGSETFVATGDDGAYVDGRYQDQTSANQAPYPASEPYMTAVGGTSLAASSTARGIKESAWSGAGSACSTFDAQPSWQATAGTGCSGRATTDVSADANPNTGIAIYDSEQGGLMGPVGGTSLAAPLTAAYAALTGVSSTSTANSAGLRSGEWAYADAGDLNDITTGSNGTCPANTSYASPQTCAAGTGWDGPTGMGSISGVVTANAGPSLTVPPDDGVDNAGNGYSVVQSLTGTGATFDGGVYPNGSTTTVWWEYGSAAITLNGTDFSAASSTSAENLAPGTAPVLATPLSVSGLTGGAVYYAEECASSHSGTDTVCGNVTQFTSEPATGGSGGSGGSGSSGGSSGSGGSGGGGSTTVAAGGSTGTSSPSGSAGSAAHNPPKVRAASIKTAPTLRGAARVGSTVRLSGGHYDNSSGVTLTFERCAHACVTVQSGRSTSYKIRAADAGHFLIAKVTVRGAHGGAQAKAVAAGVVGPVITPTLGALKIDAAHATLASGARAALVTVDRTVVKSSWHNSSTKTYLLTLTRARGLRGGLKTTLCVRSVSSLTSCSAAVTLTGTAQFSASLAGGQSLELIATR